MSVALVPSPKPAIPLPAKNGNSNWPTTTRRPTLTRHPPGPIFVGTRGAPDGAETAVAEPFEPDPGHAGEGTRLAEAHPPFVARTRAKRRTAMNEHAKIKIPSAPTSVTTGAIGGSNKVYAAP